MAVKTVNRTQRAPQAQTQAGLPFPGRILVGILFVIALVAFEIFNFDTTQFALRDFLGTASFAGLQWATVLAIAFCAIDFAGLLRFFLPEDDDGNPPAEVWYLMGAWLLGATLNALMTWWAVNLALLNHEFGNEVLSRQQLLEIVPIFVAVLVWLTRILFIGAFTVAGGYLFNFGSAGERRKKRPQPAARPLTLRRIPQRSTLGTDLRRIDEDAIPAFLNEHDDRADEDDVAATSDYEYGAGEDRDGGTRVQPVVPTRRMRRPTRAERAARRVPQKQEA